MERRRGRRFRSSRTAGARCIAGQWAPRRRPAQTASPVALRPAHAQVVLPVFQGSESVKGQVEVKVAKKIEHIGIKLELKGEIGARRRGPPPLPPPQTAPAPGSRRPLTCPRPLQSCSTTAATAPSFSPLSRSSRPRAPCSRPRCATGAPCVSCGEPGQRTRLMRALSPPHPPPDLPLRVQELRHAARIVSGDERPRQVRACSLSSQRGARVSSPLPLPPTPHAGTCVCAQVLPSRHHDAAVRGQHSWGARALGAKLAGGASARAYALTRHTNTHARTRPHKHARAHSPTHSRPARVAGPGDQPDHQDGSRHRGVPSHRV